jgi:lysine-specific demethylase 8
MREIPATDRGAYNALFALHHFFPNSQRIRARRDKIRHRVADHLIARGPGKVLPVDRVDEISPTDFRREYLAKGRPVIIQNTAKTWPCTREWSFDAWKKKYSDRTIKLAHHKGLSDHEFVYEREVSEELNFGEFLDQVISGGMKYARFSPILEQLPELLRDFDQTFLRGMPGPLSIGTTFEAFIGGTGTFTPLHNAPTPFFFVNVCGIKRWALIPNHYFAILDPPPDGMSINHSQADFTKPDPDRYPGFENIDRYEAVVGPGEIIFIPSWLWHSVRNEQPTIGVRCGFIYPWSMFTESASLFFVRVFGARNPSLLQVLYYTLLKSDLTSRNKMLLQPRMHWNYSLLRWASNATDKSDPVRGRHFNRSGRFEQSRRST